VKEMKVQNSDKSVNKETIGLSNDAKLHGCTQCEELKNRRLEAKLRAEWWKQWWQEQNAETIRTIATGKRVPGPDYIIGEPKKEPDKK
jgi:hypothetical protein